MNYCEVSDFVPLVALRIKIVIERVPSGFKFAVKPGVSGDEVIDDFQTRFEALYAIKRG